MTKLAAFIAQKIVLIREHHRLTQEEFAEKLGISLRALQRYEAGERIPKQKIMENIEAISDEITKKLDEEAFENAEKIAVEFKKGSRNNNMKILVEMIQSIPSEVYGLALEIGVNSDFWKDEIIPLLEEEVKLIQSRQEKSKQA